ncbi:MAG: 4-hydroxy-tetrahydrodipicolinate reductase [Candidatus Coatesbacteria bacterium]|nr:4-hydroxy-tetrahydrodipicolinate reductase [Candidatus Coatesbacteria bacterium]
MSDTIRLIVAGACGRMGRMILESAVCDGKFEVVGATERPGHEMVGRPLSEGVGIASLKNVPVSSEMALLLSEADVIVDFTTPSASMANFSLAAKRGKGIVIGTTGFSPIQQAQMHREAGAVRCVLSPNMSRGMNVMFVLASVLGAALADFEVEITESHHRGKKDSPSGSALHIAESLTVARGVELGDVAVYGRCGKHLERPAGQIGIHSIRAGEIVGEHTLLLAGQGERLEVTHRVESRRTFAAGALLAAEFVVNAEPGIYSMAQVLSLDKLADAVGALAK